MQLYDTPFLFSLRQFLKTSVASQTSARYNLREIVTFQEQAEKLYSSIGKQKQKQTNQNKKTKHSSNKRREKKIMFPMSNSYRHCSFREFINDNL